MRDPSHHEMRETDGRVPGACFGRFIISIVWGFRFEDIQREMVLSCGKLLLAGLRKPSGRCFPRTAPLRGFSPRRTPASAPP